MSPQLPDICPVCGLPREGDSKVCIFCGADMCRPTGAMEEPERVVVSANRRWKPVESTPRTIQADRYDEWDVIAVISAFALLVSMFLPWTRSNIHGSYSTAGPSFGWICMVSVVGMIAVAIYKGVTDSKPAVGKLYAGFGAFTIIAASLVMVIRPGVWGDVPNRVPWIGAYLGMAAGVCALASGLFSWSRASSEDRGDA